MASDAPQTFHSFSKLPAELRLQIWQDALRPVAPGVHYVTTIRPDKQEPPPGHAVARQGRYQKKTAPVLVIQTDNNPSTYMIDFGLWMACKESRWVMQRAIKKQKEGRINYATGDSLHFAARNQSDYIFPHIFTSDVTCFRRQDLRALRRDTVAVPSWNIAIEYNPTWDNMFAEILPAVPYYRRRTIEGMLFRATHNLPFYLLFLDRRMRPKPGRDSGQLKKDPPGQLPGDRLAYHMFHFKATEFHANGHSLVVIDDENAAHWDCPGSASLNFVKRLWRAVEAWPDFRCLPLLGIAVLGRID